MHPLLMLQWVLEMPTRSVWVAMIAAFFLDEFVHPMIKSFIGRCFAKIIIVAAVFGMLVFLFP